MTVCDSCVMALEDETFGELERVATTEEDVELLLTSLGGDIADHICDAIETKGEIDCRCACARREKAKRRVRARAKQRANSDNKVHLSKTTRRNFANLGRALAKQMEQMERDLRR